MRWVKYKHTNWRSIMRDDVYRKEFENRDIVAETRKIEHLREFFATTLRRFNELGGFSDNDRSEFHESLSYLYDDYVKKIV